MPSTPYGLTWADDPLSVPSPKWAFQPDIAVIESIARRVLDLSPDTAIQIAYMEEGGFNKVYTVTTGTQRFIFRVALPVDPDKVSSETATMECVRLRTSIPIPSVIAFENSNMTDLKFPWIFMEFVPGQSLDQVWRGLSFDKKKRITIQLAAFQAQLYGIRFGTIGSLIRPVHPAKPGGCPGYRAIVLTLAVILHLSLCLLLVICTSIILLILRLGQSSSTSAFPSTHEPSPPSPRPRHVGIVWSCLNPSIVILQALIALTSTILSDYIIGILPFPPPTAPDFQPGRITYSHHLGALENGVSIGPYPNSYQWLRARLLRVLDYTEQQIILARLSASDELEDFESNRRSATILLNHLSRVFSPTAVDEMVISHADLRDANILVDANGTISSILDWEHCPTVPLWLATSYPLLLVSKRRRVEPQKEGYGSAEPCCVDDVARYRELYGMCEQYWEAHEQYELTLLRSVYSEEMDKLVPGWTARNKETRFQRVFEEEITKLETGFSSWPAQLDDWLGAYTGSGFPRNRYLWPLLEEDLPVIDERTSEFDSSSDGDEESTEDDDESTDEDDEVPLAVEDEEEEKTVEGNVSCAIGEKHAVGEGHLAC